MLIDITMLWLFIILVFTFSGVAVAHLGNHMRSRPIAFAGLAVFAIDLIIIVTAGAWIFLAV